MQKLDVKLDKKTVGVALKGDPLKQSKGITLIALIITIIVMLILVGVTITVALNGGLFVKAEKTTKEVEKQAILEQIIGSIELTNNGKIDKEATYLLAEKVLNGQGKTVEKVKDETDRIVLSVDGEYKYIITAEEISHYEAETFTFTLGELAANSEPAYPGFMDERFVYVVFPATTSEGLVNGINSTSIITCSDPILLDVSKWDGSGDEPTSGFIFEPSNHAFVVDGLNTRSFKLTVVIDGVEVKRATWYNFVDDYSDLRFTITCE